MVLPAFARPLLLGLAVLGGCAANPGSRPGHTVSEEVFRLLAIDFSPRAANRRIASFRRVLDLPAGEVKRTQSLSTTAAMAAAGLQRRTSRLPRLPVAAMQAEAKRVGKLLSPARLHLLPGPDGLARNTARDLERLGMLLGFEQRPLGESSDRRHRVDPDDDRPELSLWQRLRRRILP